MQFFCCVTVSYAQKDFYHVKLTEEPTDESWCVQKLRVTEKADVAFLSLYQYNQKFQDPFDDSDLPSDVERGVIPIGKSISNLVAQQSINEHAEDVNAARNRQEAYKDKGHGVLLEKNKDLEELQKIFASRDVQYPLLKLIVCKVGKLVGENED